MPAPELIWIYWENPPGVSAKPPLIEACLSTIHRNSGCEVVVVSKDSLEDYIGEVHPAIDYLSCPHQADLFRLNVLYQHGGMYLDADTIVASSVRHLFSRLEEFEYVGADWRPAGYPESDPITVGIMGPCRPKLQFLQTAVARQNAVLNRKLERLRAGQYPIAWGEILNHIVVPSFNASPPHACIRDGAKSWLSLVGGPQWHPCPNHAFQPDHELGEIPPSELYTLCYSLMPEHLRAMTLEDLLESRTILARLLKHAGVDAQGVHAG